MPQPNSQKDIENQLPEDKMPPQNPEAEKSVLGSLMIDKDAMNQVVDLLKPEAFYKTKHAKIYQAMIDLYENSEPIDVLSLSGRLEEKGQLDSVGSKSYLSTLASGVPTAAHVTNYAKIVSKKKILRDLISASYDIGQMGYKEDAEIDTLLDQAEKRIFSIAQETYSQDFLALKDPLQDAFERIDRLHKKEGDKLRGISTGLDSLDEILSGLQPSDLVILAARPRVGKTSLALDIARHVGANEDKGVCVFSIEMATDQLADRLLAQQAGVNLWKMRTGNLSFSGEFNDFARIQEALGTLSGAPIYIDDSASSNPLQMKAMARRLQAETDLGLIVIDYLQLMSGATRSDNRVQEITEISRSLKELAQELEVPVLALSQLSRAVEKRSPPIPKLSDLRESGSIEQDADVVMFIYREREEGDQSGLKNEASLIVAKHRNGPVGEVDVYFDEKTASYRDLDKKHVEE